MRGFFFRLATVLVVSLGIAGCDSAPGVMDTGGTPPRVSNLVFSPVSVVFDQLPDDSIVGDTLALIDLQIRVEATDVDDDIDSVAFVISDPFDAFEPLASGTLSRRGNSDIFEGSRRLSIPRGNDGRYTVLTYAVDSELNISNQIRGILDYQLGSGNPPVIESIIGPTEITPPVQLTLVAVVSDPDGLGNIASVVVTTPTGQERGMVDDGQSFGDEEAGDGRYTARFDVPAAEPGTFTFTFQAFDRQGLSSNVVTFDITVK